MAADEINAAGGVKGTKVRVLMEDDKSNVQETSKRVLQLIDRDKVIAVLGEVTPARSKAGALVANNKHIPMISASSTNAGRETPSLPPRAFRERRAPSASIKIATHKNRWSSSRSKMGNSSTGSRRPGAKIPH
jgi:ABC-type branched-subunit amino acid transport system substrate-binding protein